MELLPYIVVFGAWVGGGFVSIVTGFGCGLFALPVMLLCLPPEQAIPVNCVLCSVAMSLILIRYWKNIDWFHFALLSVAALPGSFLGVYVLNVLPIRWIELGFGIFLLGCVGWEWGRKHINLAAASVPGLRTELGFGFIAGFIDGLIGMGGPALGVYAVLAHWEQDRTRGTFGLFFGLNLLLCALLLFYNDFVGAAELKLIAWAVPGALAGTLAGIPVAGRIRQETFIKLLLVVITLSGLIVIAKAAG